MGWAARKKRGGAEISKPSEVAKAYTLKHIPEAFEERKGFLDARGRGYAVAPDGSLRRLAIIDGQRVFVDRKLRKSKKQRVRERREMRKDSDATNA